MIEYPKDVKSLTVMLQAAQREVSRLSSTVSIQSERVSDLHSEVQRWERRFDQLSGYLRMIRK